MVHCMSVRTTTTFLVNTATLAKQVRQQQQVLQQRCSHTTYANAPPNQSNSQSAGAHEITS
jgi:hypothetical protein